MVVAGWAGIVGEPCHEQGFLAWTCGAARAWPGIVGSLARDERGMHGCLTEQHVVGVARLLFRKNVVLRVEHDEVQAGLLGPPGVRWD